MAETFPTLEAVTAIARQAGGVLREFASRERNIESKGYTDVVTDADKASEAAILAAIRAQFPDHAIIAEESGRHSGLSGWTWIIDPLDGTLNYLHGLPIYAVSIGVLRDGVPTFGAVYDPSRDEMFAAERGRGAFLNGVPIRVSATATLATALVTTGFPYERTVRPDNNLREFAHVLMLVQDVRRPGSAALDLAYVAAGRTDGYWELGVKPWDIAAGGLLVREAGGSLTEWDGNDWSPWSDKTLATNGHLHTALMAALAHAAE